MLPEDSGSVIYCWLLIVFTFMLATDCFYPYGIELFRVLPRRLPPACRGPALWMMEVGCLLLADSDIKFCIWHVEYALGIL